MKYLNFTSLAMVSCGLLLSSCDWFSDSGYDDEIDESLYKRSSSSRNTDDSSSEVYSSSSRYIPAEGSIEKACDECNAFEDARDGEIYRVTKIGTQVWMAENLRYEKTWKYVHQKSYCIAEDGDCSVRGLLYTFNAANDVDDGLDIPEPNQGICPDGFHVPASAEWSTLISWMHSEKGYSGAKLSSALMANYGWLIFKGEDEFGFSMVATGEYGKGVVNDDQTARFWTSTATNSSAGEEFYFKPDFGSSVQVYDKNFAYALRCVADGKVIVDKVKEWSRGSAYSSSSTSSSSYEQEFSLTTAEDCPECNAIVDTRNNQSYLVGKIGGDIWMLEDLQYKGTADHELPPQFYCPEGGMIGNGCLYSNAVAQEVCPEGWALPTHLQMENLAAQEKLEDFNLLPTGEWQAGSNWEEGQFKMDNYARYWTSTYYDENKKDAFMWYFSVFGESKSQPYTVNYGYAVRCVATGDVVMTTKKYL